MGQSSPHTVFQHLVKVLEVLHDDIAMLFQYGQCNKKVELAALEVGPESLPEAEHICPLKLALIPDKQHSEEEEKVGRVGFFEVEVEGGVHKLDEVVECEKLIAHAGLVAEEVSFHAIHEADEAPECDCIILLDGIDRCQEIAHALNVAKVAVVFVVCQ